MKLFDHSKISGKSEDEVREKLYDSIKKELELKKLYEDIKSSKYNRIFSLIAIIISLISIAIAIISILH